MSLPSKCKLDMCLSSAAPLSCSNASFAICSMSHHHLLQHPSLFNIFDIVLPPNASWTLIYHCQHASCVQMWVFWHVWYFYYHCHLLHILLPLCSPFLYANVSQSHYSHFPSSLFLEGLICLLWLRWCTGYVQCLWANSILILAGVYHCLPCVQSPPSFDGTCPSSNQQLTQAIQFTLTSCTTMKECRC